MKTNNRMAQKNKKILSENLIRKIVEKIGFDELVKNNCTVEVLKMLNVTCSNNTICFYDENEQFHSYNDLPAIIYGTEKKRWYKNGKIHRENDKPAEIRADGTEVWHKNDLVHRDNDKPAIVFSTGQKVWFRKGRFIKQEL
jgi:hypothetical protein